MWFLDFNAVLPFDTVKRLDFSTDVRSSKSHATMSFFLKGKRFDIIVITEFMSADACTSHSTSTSDSDDKKKHVLMSFKETQQYRFTMAYLQLWRKRKKENEEQLIHRLERAVLLPIVGPADTSCDA